MANPLYIHDVVSQNGSQRDLLDAITLVDAKETPFMALAPKGTAPTNVNFEWPVDKNLAPKLNATKDGQDLTHNSSTPANSDFDNSQEDYAVLSNRVQWFRRQALVGKLAQDVQNQAGIKDHLAYATTKNLLALKRDMEVAFCADELAATATDVTSYTAEAVTGSASAANRTRALGKWINSSNSNVDSDFRTPSASIHTGTVASLTEDEVNGVIESVYNETGQRGTMTLLCGTKLKGRFKSYYQTQHGTQNVAASVRVYNADLADKKITNTVDVYEGDFGTIELVPSLWVNHGYGVSDLTSPLSTDTGYLLDMDLIELRFNQLPQVQPLPDLGGGPRFAVDAIAGLCVKNPLALGAFKCAQV
jgi:hypothetical protein